MKIAYGGGLLGREALCFQGREILKQLAKTHTVELIHKDLGGYFEKFYGNVKKGKEDVCIFNGHTPHMPELAKDYKKIINICVFETSLPPGWADALNIPEVVEVWTVSEFCKSLIIKAGVKKPVRVTYLGVDERIFKTTANLFPKNDSFLFFNISAPHCLGKKDRKGLDVLVKAFKQEFGDSTEVTLVLKMNTIYADRNARKIGGFTPHRYIKSLLPEGTDTGNIAILSEYLNYQVLNYLYNSINCAVFPARAEGFGLCQAEAIKLGIPTITTNYSSTNEFSDKRLRIDVKEMAPLDTNEFPYFDSLFAEPDIQSLRKLMREVYENQASHLIKAKLFAKNIDKFNWETVGKKMNEFLQKVI